MQSGAIPADDLTEALVELELINCNGDERASHTSGVERAAAAVVQDGDENHDEMITYGEFEEMKRSAEEEVGDAANAVIATLQSGECVVGHILEEMSATTPGNGRMLATSRRRRRRSLSEEYSDEEYRSAMNVMKAMPYTAMSIELHHTARLAHGGSVADYCTRTRTDYSNQYAVRIDMIYCATVRNYSYC